LIKDSSETRAQVRESGFQRCNNPGKTCMVAYPQAMPSRVKSPAKTKKLPQSRGAGVLACVQTPDPVQLDNIKAQLDLVLLALEALAGIGSEAMLQAAAQLNLNSQLTDRVTLWRLRQSSPLRKGSGRKKLDVEEARDLVAIACHLAKEHQELIRRAVAALEQVGEENRPPHTVALLGDYIDNFSNTYQERMLDGEETSPDILSDLALKLLIDLLFYSGPGGPRRFWLALLDRSM